MSKLTSIRLDAQAQAEVAAIQAATGIRTVTDVINQAVHRMHKGAMMKQSAYQLAETRIDATPELRPYRKTILYDWNEGDEHYRWAATAPIAEIVDWAQVIEAQVD